MRQLNPGDMIRFKSTLQMSSVVRSGATSLGIPAATCKFAVAAQLGAVASAPVIWGPRSRQHPFWAVNDRMCRYLLITRFHRWAFGISI